MHARRLNGPRTPRRPRNTWANSACNAPVAARNRGSSRVVVEYCRRQREDAWDLAIDATLVNDVPTLVSVRSSRRRASVSAREMCSPLVASCRMRRACPAAAIRMVAMMPLSARRMPLRWALCGTVAMTSSGPTSPTRHALAHRAPSAPLMLVLVPVPATTAFVCICDRVHVQNRGHVWSSSQQAVVVGLLDMMPLNVSTARPTDMAKVYVATASPVRYAMGVHRAPTAATSVAYHTGATRDPCQNRQKADVTWR